MFAKKQGVMINKILDAYSFDLESAIHKGTNAQ